MKEGRTTRMRKKLILTLLSLLLMPTLIFNESGVQAKKHTKSRQNDTITANASHAIGDYAKIFKKKSLLSTCKSLDFALYLYDNKLYMEVPERLMGRELLVNSIVNSSSSLRLNGVNASPSTCIVMQRTDSMVVFKQPQANYAISEYEENSTLEALKRSRLQPILSMFPIKAWNKDSTKVLFECTKYFKANNKQIFDLKGKAYEDGVSVGTANVKNDVEFFEGITAFDKCLCINKTFSAELTLMFSLGELQRKPLCQFSLQTMIALLPDKTNMMPTREAHGSVGSGFVAYDDYRQPNDAKKGFYTTRRRYLPGDTIKFYVDTLISKSWKNSIQKAALAWNKAFEHQHLGSPILLLPFPKDSAFSSNNPMTNIIAFANNLEQRLTINNVIDPRTGEILGTRIRIPRNLASNVRRNGIAKMAEVDERYRTYYLPDDLLCEILQAYCLTAFGRSLGLSTNLAGSAAYSPEQLRSPQFTQQYGISASVMDGMIYNYLAMPGDKERGVVLTFNKPGVCDEFVLKYLYTPLHKGEEKDSLNYWISQHNGDPQYKYGKPNMFLAADPTSLALDMGNDPIAASRALLHHLKYAARHADSWFDTDHLPTEFTVFFPEFMMLEIMNNLGSNLRMFVGGVYQNEWIPKSKVPLTQPVPKELQRRVVKEILYEYDDLSWMDTKEIEKLHGVTNSIDSWASQNVLAYHYLYPRLQSMNISVDHSANPYSQEDLLQDLEDYAFSAVRKRSKINSKEIMKMAKHVSTLINLSPELASISSIQRGQTNGFAYTIYPELQSTILRRYDISMQIKENSLYPEINGVLPTKELEYYHAVDLSPMLLQRLKRAKFFLVKAKTMAKNSFDANRIDAIILAANRILNN